MPDQTVPTDTGELTGYAATAAELHRIADDLAKLSDQPGQAAFTIYLQPHRSKTDDDVTKAAVDAVGMALYGKPGEYLRMSSGKYHYVRYGYRGAIQLQIFQEVSGPPDERDAELERLRAEVATLRSAEDPDHGRTTAVGEAKPDTLMVPHGDPGDGHAYECCGKVGRISKHRPGCPVGGE